MSKKTRKDGKPVNATRKTRPKDKPPAEATEATAPVGNKSAAPPPARPLVVSNTEEGGVYRLLLTLLFVTVLAAGAFATQTLWSPYVVDYLPGLKGEPETGLPESSLAERLGEVEREVVRMRQGGEAIADLERQRGELNQSFEGVMARILELEERIEKVQGMLQSGASQVDVDSANDTLQRLSSRMSELESGDSTVDVVMQRLARLEKAMAEGGSDASTDRQMRAQTLMLAVAHLRETLRSSAPFAPALAALKTLGQGEETILRGVDELSPFAESGIVTMSALRRQYAAVAKAIAAAQPGMAPEEEPEGAFDGAINTIKSLVSIRKAAAPASAADPGNPVEKARIRLDAGDLSDAVAILSQLSGPQAEAAAPWLERARARIRAESTLSRLHAYVFSKLAPFTQ